MIIGFVFAVLFPAFNSTTLIESGLYIFAGSLGEAGGSFPIIYFKVM